MGAIILFKRFFFSKSLRMFLKSNTIFPEGRLSTRLFRNHMCSVLAIFPFWKTRALKNVRTHPSANSTPFTGTLPHELPFHFCIRRQLYQDNYPHPRVRLGAVLGVLNCVVQPAPLRLSPLCHLTVKQPAASTTSRYLFPLLLSALGHNSAASPNSKGGGAFRGPVGGLKHPEVVF